ncbi:NinE family protein [Erwinia phage Midgardsormr38]|uniref:Protein ninE n=1 Tax=Erwinia phage Midgardsormr38 TaxID=2663326 RepID=A0A5Q2FA18_9CAUD|nr:NinE family protein [Erwinia phage Midgardsormr38]QGF22033.1 NinE family protein [Erwinia phage Midgardsormr38]
MSRQKVSATQRAIDSLIFTPTARSRSKRKSIPAASQVNTYDYVYTLLRAKFDRMRRSR